MFPPTSASVTLGSLHVQIIYTRTRTQQLPLLKRIQCRLFQAYNCFTLRKQKGCRRLQFTILNYNSEPG